MTEEQSREEQGRDEALRDMMETGREHSAATIMFHTAVSASQGLNPTESKTLDLLVKHGPLTAKDLVAHTGLAPASVTGLVDRLSAKGFVRRTKHATDKRRVTIELNREKISELASFFDTWAKDVVAACDEFSTEDLRTVTRFLAVMTEVQREAAARLSR
ncbi:MarR family winged helix-turn-helix transcriptional regulator [Streptomyces sp. VRA16 Mangrove soil]|uniref:MarR family winged helix-turn-helix transcriptional regulator n=1 Tax=Streptomyces sp. VRA16 Mangrove soil TaxID=2817434 RepID=UPI001A9EC48C|nr:MarR family transcriptional regulator [Streptomyces sp. VRA16 Mangrove soil]MBO1333506.1 MarR family transcriptional regulator [Streptomyces sp. VRA16 Mangrove soil]